MSVNQIINSMTTTDKTIPEGLYKASTVRVEKEKDDTGAVITPAAKQPKKIWTAKSLKKSPKINFSTEKIMVDGKEINETEDSKVPIAKLNGRKIGHGPEKEFTPLLLDKEQADYFNSDDEFVSHYTLTQNPVGNYNDHGCSHIARQLALNLILKKIASYKLVKPIILDVGSNIHRLTTTLYRLHMDADIIALTPDITAYDPFREKNKNPDYHGYTVKEYKQTLQEFLVNELDERFDFVIYVHSMYEIPLQAIADANERSEMKISYAAIHNYHLLRTDSKVLNNEQKVTFRGTFPDRTFKMTLQTHLVNNDKRVDTTESYEQPSPDWLYTGYEVKQGTLMGHCELMATSLFTSIVQFAVTKIPPNAIEDWNGCIAITLQHYNIPSWFKYFTYSDLIYSLARNILNRYITVSYEQTVWVDKNLLNESASKWMMCQQNVTNIRTILRSLYSSMKDKDAVDPNVLAAIIQQIMRASHFDALWLPFMLNLDNSELLAELGIGVPKKNNYFSKIATIASLSIGAILFCLLFFLLFIVIWIAWGNPFQLVLNLFDKLIGSDDDSESSFQFKAHNYIHSAKNKFQSWLEWFSDKPKSVVNNVKRMFTEKHSKEHPPIKIIDIADYPDLFYDLASEVPIIVNPVPYEVDKKTKIDGAALASLVKLRVIEPVKAELFSWEIKQKFGTIMLGFYNQTAMATRPIATVIGELLAFKHRIFVSTAESVELVANKWAKCTHWSSKLWKKYLHNLKDYYEMCPEDWLIKQTPNAQSHYKQSIEIDWAFSDDKNHKKRIIHCKTDEKFNNLIEGQVEAKIMRIICGEMPSTVAIINPAIWDRQRAYERLAISAFSDGSIVNWDFIITCAFNPIQLGQLLNMVIKHRRTNDGATFFVCGDDMIAVNGSNGAVTFMHNDKTVFDATVTSGALKFERHLLNSIANFSEDEKSVYEQQAYTLFRSSFWAGSFTAIRHSGDPNTTFGNSLLCGISAVYDYEVVSGQIKTVNQEFWNTWSEQQKEFGFMNKPKFTTKLSEISYLSSRPLPVMLDGVKEFVFCPLPGKNLLKLTNSISETGLKDWTKLAQNICLSGLLSFSADPYSTALLNAWAQKLGGVDYAKPTGYINYLYRGVATYIDTIEKIVPLPQEVFQFNVERYGREAAERLELLSFDYEKQKLVSNIEMPKSVIDYDN